MNSRRIGLLLMAVNFGLLGTLAYMVFSMKSDPTAMTGTVRTEVVTNTVTQIAVRKINATNNLLAALADSAGRVLSREALMERVRGDALEAFDRSIDVHVSRIRAAIEDDPRHPRRILTVRGAGYVFARVQDDD